MCANIKTKVLIKTRINYHSLFGHENGLRMKENCYADHEATPKCVIEDDSLPRRLCPQWPVEPRRRNRNIDCSNKLKLIK